MSITLTSYQSVTSAEDFQNIVNQILNAELTKPEAQDCFSALSEFHGLELKRHKLGVSSVFERADEVRVYEIRWLDFNPIYIKVTWAKGNKFLWWSRQKAAFC